MAGAGVCVAWYGAFAYLEHLIAVLRYQEICLTEWGGIERLVKTQGMNR